MDISTLVNDTWQAIQPLLPLIALKGAEKLGEEAGGALWETIKAKFQQKPAAEESLEDLLQSPEDKDFQAVFRMQLKKMLQNDADFSSRLENLLNLTDTSYAANLNGDGAIAQGDGATAVGKGGVYIGGSAKGNTIVTGNGNLVEKVIRD